ncbi:MAG TPA: hypothetical protein VFX59_08800 [Polyangiales bacterium]|nr:hypothetical protein [Polyangiales bacterium]
MNAARLTIAAALGVSACAHGGSIEARVTDLAAIAREAREHGAYRCAPEELALAEAELEFARAELGLGDPARAEEHVVRAHANARAALRLSADPSCRAAHDASPEARHQGPTRAERLSMTQPPVRRGSTKEHAAI